MELDVNGAIVKNPSAADIVRALPLRNGRRTTLYSVMAYHDGENLAERIRRKGGLRVMRRDAVAGRAALAGRAHPPGDGLRQRAEKRVDQPESAHPARGDTLIVNPGEACGWLYGAPSAAILDRDTRQVEFLTLDPAAWPT